MSYDFYREVVTIITRILGTIFIMAGSIGLGLYFSARESLRIKELLEVKKALLILWSEIEFLSTPLATACENIAHRTENTVAKLFENFSARLGLGEGGTAYTHWAQSLDYVAETSFMKAEDFSVLEGFGKTLGYLDKIMQKNAIDHTTHYIDDTVATLQAASQKSRRMYHSLGVVGGLLVVIMLW